MTGPDPCGTAALGEPARSSVPTLPVEDLMVQLVQRANDIVAAQQRLRGLLAANRSIVGELSLPRVLQRVVDAARETVGARYAALGVLGSDGTLAELVHSGLDAEVAGRIAAFPRGHGLLGELDGYPAPVRVAQVEADPRSAGFPEGHPRMETFLGAPIQADGTVFGHLYLTEPLHGGVFTAEDEELVAALAATAGIAVENARLYEESRRRQEWLLAAGEVSRRLLATGEDERQVWRLIATRVQRLSDADAVWLVVPTPDSPPELEVVAAAGPHAESLPGRRDPAEGSIAWAAMQSGRGLVADPDGVPPTWAAAAELGSGSLMALPLRGEWGSRGGVVVARRPGRPQFTPAEVGMAEDFARQAAVALELADARATAQRVGALEDRERIARDLHDHVIQRLFATGLGLKSTATSIPNPVVRDRLGRTVQDLDETIRQIRTSIFALKYARPASSSLRATVLAVVDAAGSGLGFRPAARLAGPLDTLVDDDLVDDVAAVVREALTNVARHAHATRAEVAVVVDGRQLDVTVTDDGAGLGGRRPGRGLTDLAERAERHGGAFALESPPPGGLCLRWSIPLS